MRIAILTRQIGNYHHARFSALAAADVDFAVVSLANEGNFTGFVSTARTDYAVHRIYDGKAEYARAVKDGRAESDVCAALDAIGADVVALPGWACAESFAGLRWAYREGAAVVMMSDSQAADAARSGWREAIKSRIVNLCDAGFVAGDVHRDYLANLGMPKDRISLGYDVTDNAHFAKGAAAARSDEAAMRAKHGLPSRPYFLASGRFIAKKNLPALVTAYGALAALRPDCPDLCILGDGEERATLEGAINAAHVSQRVHLLGFRSYEDLPAIYGLAEAFIHPALHEQWGLVISEAGASAIPLAVSRTAGAAQLVEEGRNGVLFDAADTADIQRALARLAELSPEERRQWGNESALIMQDWGPERYVAGLSSAAENALAARGKTASSRAIPIIDKALIAYLGRKIIMDVS